ncbi:SpoIID/LytB domain-containing protein [Oscillospiraceae bacterium OttesenSCG-928-F05]|nr:SpoIID/LytB domain-containing protein [Oscillospiraceae bacterium OttesenSCG-928-F05]
MRRFTAFALALCLFFALPPAAGMRAGAAAEPEIRVGLYYGNNALPSANLQNVSGFGSGYDFGYFDSARQFISLGFTGEETITVLKNKTMYVSGGTYYESLPPSGATTIGAYFADVATCASYEEARSAAGGVNGAFPAYINGAFKVLVGSFASEGEARSAAANLGYGNASAVGNSATCYVVTETGSGRVLFAFDAGKNATLAIRPTGAAYPVTWFKKYKYAGIFEYRRNNGNDISVINVLPLSEYAKGVIPYEMSPSWPVEALKAQAVCAMNYAYSSRNKHNAMGFDVCNTTDCQVYHGRNSATDYSDSAAAAVAGIGLYYGTEICNTVYHSSNGGSTESAKNVWGRDVAYLQPVSDNFEDLTAAYNGIWSFEYTAEDVAWVLNNKGYSIGKVANMYVSKFTDAGNVYELTVVDTSGKTLTFTQERARTILNSDTLKKYTHSHRYTINAATGGGVYVNDGSGRKGSLTSSYTITSGGQISVITKADGELYAQTKDGVQQIQSNGAPSTPKNGTFLIVGKGWGHNVGMSQYGAKGMAERGYTYDQILEYYYTGAKVQAFLP